jgi:Predicted acyltransferases
VESLKTELMCVISCSSAPASTTTTPVPTAPASSTIYSAILLTLFLVCWPHTVWLDQMPSVPQNYIYGFLVFTVSYCLRRFFRPLAPLDFIANISYSIYVLHSIIGYLSIRILMDKGLSFPVSGLLTLLFVLGLAYLLHRWVEVPTMHLGKRLFAKKVKPAAAQPAASVEVAR